MNEPLTYTATRWASEPERGLQLYYTAKSPDTPTPVKMMIYSALVYLIIPLDTVPDPLPGGYLDDLGALGATLVAASAYVTSGIKKKAASEANRWIEKE